MVRSLVLFALVAGAIGFVWHGLGEPKPMPPSPLDAGEKLTCVSYTPFHGDQAPFATRIHIPDTQIAADMQRLSGLTSCVRTYAAASGQDRVAAIAGAHGLKVLQGIWLGRDLADNRAEIESAVQLARRHPDVIQGLVVGNETLLRGELSAAQVKDYIAEVRRRTNLPVTYADVWEFWLKAPELVEAVDFVTIHILPYWEDEPVAAEHAVAHVRQVREAVGAAFSGKDILIGEVGWPSAGRMRGEALPSRANQARVLSGLVALAKEEGWKVNLIEAFDQPWKRLLEGTVGGHWGIYDNAERAPKSRFGEPVSNHPHWRIKAGLGIGAALLVFCAYWLGGGGRVPGDWRRDTAVSAMALASGLAFGWAAANIPVESPFPGDRLRAAIMLALALVVPMASAFALACGVRLPGFAPALLPSRWRAGNVTPILAGLFAATVVVAIHAALGLVFDSRYKDFPFASLTGPAVALAILALARPAAPGRRSAAELVAAIVLALSALFIVVNEGLENWQALWFAGLLFLLALTAFRVRGAPG